MSPSANSLAEKLQTLSPEQIATVEEFVEFLSIRGQDRGLTRAATATSSPAFERVWSNPEDEVYDAL
ncbi:MAG: hypothetical protein ACRD3N_00725 [Terracidiphilus sp.]